MTTTMIRKDRKAPGTSPAYKPTAGALLDLAVATENGSLRDHPLRKVEPGVYTAAEGRFTVAKTGAKWSVIDGQTGVTTPAMSYENCRLIVNQTIGARLDAVPAVVDSTPAAKPAPKKRRGHK